MPSLYGIGTALPVIVFASLLASATGSVGRIYHSLTRVEYWARRITGLLFIAAGLYYCLVYIFGA
jgi:threonine/homoserine/homoserine lactone efflux protein